MVRNYKRKISRGQNGSMPDAIELVEEGHTIRSAAEVTGVNYVTL